MDEIRKEDPHFQDNEVFIVVKIHFVVFWAVASCSVV
jgi:hypothetical protein